jgi:hypothetical protein
MPAPELDRGDVRSRVGQRRYDVTRMPMEALLMTGAVVAAIVLMRPATRTWRAAAQAGRRSRAPGTSNRYVSPCAR